MKTQLSPQPKHSANTLHRRHHRSPKNALSPQSPPKPTVWRPTSSLRLSAAPATTVTTSTTVSLHHHHHHTHFCRCQRHNLCRRRHRRRQTAVAKQSRRQWPHLHRRCRPLGTFVFGGFWEIIWQRSGQAGSADERRTMRGLHSARGNAWIWPSC